MSRWLFRKRKKDVIVGMVLIMFFLILSCNGTSLSMGKGEIEKLCIWDNDMPIPDVEVFLDDGGSGETLFTDQFGSVVFTDLSSGDYVIYCDVDGDGVWDGEPDYVTLGVGESIYIVNVFPLPKIFKSSICFPKLINDVVCYEEKKIC